MSHEHEQRLKWTTLFVFAIAMAWVESAVVFYIRTLVDRIEPYQAHPLPLIGPLGPVELIRELATMIMLLTVGCLAGKTWRSRWGYVAVAFGVWDIFYYVFLKLMCGWPHSLLDWDILFLLPLPWWGPVLAPVLISGLMILWGTLATQFEQTARADAPSWNAWMLGSSGLVIALYTFMADAIRVADGGVLVLREMLPTTFNWPLFGFGFALMSAPVWSLCLELWPGSEIRSAKAQSL
jgi:hypothetical protein